MARLPVIEGFDAYLAANWTQTPIVKMNAANSSPPLKGEPYIQAIFPVANEDQKSWGVPEANIYRETGAVQIRVYGRKGAGLAATVSLADALADLFRGKRIADNLQCKEVDSAALHDENDRGNYFVVGVIVNYDHDLIG